MKSALRRQRGLGYCFELGSHRVTFITGHRRVHRIGMRTAGLAQQAACLQRDDSSTVPRRACRKSIRANPEMALPQRLHLPQHFGNGDC
jgi:hypothetical protein